DAKSCDIGARERVFRVRVVAAQHAVGGVPVHDETGVVAAVDLDVEVVLDVLGRAGVELSVLHPAIGHGDDGRGVARAHDRPGVVAQFEVAFVQAVDVLLQGPEVEAFNIRLVAGHRDDADRGADTRGAATTNMGDRHAL